MDLLLWLWNFVSILDHLNLTKWVILILESTWKSIYRRKCFQSAIPPRLFLNKVILLCLVEILLGLKIGLIIWGLIERNLVWLLMLLVNVILSDRRLVERILLWLLVVKMHSLVRSVRSVSQLRYWGGEVFIRR